MVEERLPRRIHEAQRGAHGRNRGHVAGTSLLLLRGLRQIPPHRADIRVRKEHAERLDEARLFFLTQEQDVVDLVNALLVLLQQESAANRLRRVERRQGAETFYVDEMRIAQKKDCGIVTSNADDEGIPRRLPYGRRRLVSVDLRADNGTRQAEQNGSFGL